MLAPDAPEPAQQASSYSGGPDPRPQVAIILATWRRELPMMERVLEETRGAGQCGMRKFFNGSYKAARLTAAVEQLVPALRQVAIHEGALDGTLEEIIAEGLRPRDGWREDARPVMDAYLHTRYALEACAESARILETVPSLWGPPICWMYALAATMGEYDAKEWRRIKRGRENAAAEDPAAQERVGEVRIWLDDLRDPEDPAIQRDFGAHGDEAWCKTMQEALGLLAEGHVAHISFDHDLGAEETGYDLAKILEQYAAHGRGVQVAWNVHTANPVGRAKIFLAMRRADQLWEERRAAQVAADGVDGKSPEVGG